MTLHGKNILGGERCASGGQTFRAWDPAAGVSLDPLFHEAALEEADRALQLADEAFQAYRKVPPDRIASFLEAIAVELTDLGAALIDRAVAETGLTADRLTGERARTVNQIRMFAQLVRDGSWVDARIDRAIPDRKPLPKPDVRRMLVPIGPVVVFTASNFPLAFSVAGGDTASALAAGNPVVVKAQRSHPGTSELAAEAIQKAVERAGLPAGVFSMVHGSGPVVGIRLVTHPLARAVAFTGSLEGGRALFDAAARRPDPIPVYAEMGSLNPVFVLPGALRERGDAIAEGLKQSVTLGNGQFCTKPGAVLGLEGPDLRRFAGKVAVLIAQVPPGTLLHPGILRSYEEGVGKMSGIHGVRVTGRSESPAAAGKARAAAAVFETDAVAFCGNRLLSEEVFGPSTLLVGCSSRDEMEKAARHLQGHLTATIHGTDEDLREFRDLVSVLATKAGRLVFNGFPTGVEVCPSMHHGGPYPATTDARSTSVGTAAIQRFVRPLCWQNFPDDALPPELQNGNPRRLWRQVDGEFGNGSCGST